MQRIFQYQAVEAEDPAAVKRVIEAFAGGDQRSIAFTDGQLVSMEAVTRRGLAGRSVVEIEDIREQACDEHRASTAADGDQDDARVRAAELRLSVCSGVLTWMQRAGADHYDGRSLSDET